MPQKRKKKDKNVLGDKKMSRKSRQNAIKSRKGVEKNAIKKCDQKKGTKGPQ